MTKPARCPKCGHELPRRKTSWLEAVGLITLIFLGARLFFSVFTPPSATRAQPTRQYQTYTEDQPDEEQIRADHEDATSQYYDDIASTAQADRYKTLAEDAARQATRDAAFYEPDCIHWSQAYAYTGQDTCVTGDVYSTHQSDKAFFINFSPNRTAFYSVSFDWFWEDLEGECITIHGTIETYEGRPQIIIHHLDQLQYCQ